MRVMIRLLRLILSLHLVWSALAPPSSQSASSSSASSTMRQVLACNSKTVGWAGHFDSQDGKRQCFGFRLVRLSHKCPVKKRVSKSGDLTRKTSRCYGLVQPTLPCKFGRGWIFLARTPPGYSAERAPPRGADPPPPPNSSTSGRSEAGGAAIESSQRMLRDGTYNSCEPKFWQKVSKGYQEGSNQYRPHTK